MKNLLHPRSSSPAAGDSRGECPSPGRNGFPRGRFQQYPRAGELLLLSSLRCWGALRRAAGRPCWSLLLWAPARDWNWERFWSLSKYWLDLIRQEEPQRAIAAAAAAAAEQFCTFSLAHFLFPLLQSQGYSCFWLFALRQRCSHGSSTAWRSLERFAVQKELAKGSAMEKWGGGCRIKCRSAQSDNGSVAAEERAWTEIWKYQFPSFPSLWEIFPCWHPGVKPLLSLWPLPCSTCDSMKIINPSTWSLAFGMHRKGRIWNQVWDNLYPKSSTAFSASTVQLL